MIKFLIASVFSLIIFTSGVNAQDVSFEVEEVPIKTKSGILTFQMEIATSREQRQQGLMYRTSIKEGHGMLFDYGYPYVARMWMKNTLIPLDMLFVRADGSIAYIHHRAIPGDLSEIGAGEPVRAVIELAGGQAKKLSITTGDTVLYSIFKTEP